MKDYRSLAKAGSEPWMVQAFKLVRETILKAAMLWHSFDSEKEIHSREERKQ